MRSRTKILLFLTSVFTYFVVVGLTAVCLPIILKYNNVPESLIGLSDNIKVIAGLLILALLPRIASKLGIIGTGVFSLILYGISILLLPLYKNYLFWSMLMFLFGTGFIVFRTMEESLINVIANNNNRGKLMGYTSTTMLAGLSLGPIIPKFLGTLNYANFIISAIAIAISAVCFGLLKKMQGNIKPTKNFQLIRFIKDLPEVFFSKCVMEFYVQVIFVFSVIYATEKSNYTTENAGLFITFFSLSGFFNMFIGRFLDTVKNKYIPMVCGVFVLFITMALFPLTLKINITLSYLLFFIFGLCGSSLVFLSSMYILNSHYSKKELVAANSALTFTDAIGMVSGSFFTGIAMDYFGVDGFFVPMGILAVIYIIFCIILYVKRKA